MRPLTAATVAESLEPAGHLARNRAAGLRQAGHEAALRGCGRGRAVVRRSRNAPGAGSASPSSAAAISSSSRSIQPRLARRAAHLAMSADLDKAFLLARSHSPSERVMVEQYLAGPQVSTESLVVDGRCFTAGLLRPQLRISRALCALLHREWRRSAEPSAGRDASQGARSGGARRRGARHHERHGQGRHRRP